VEAAIAAERMGPTPTLTRRVRVAAIVVPAIVLLAGAAGGINRPAFVLVAAAVVFGWSQLAGA
jgi:hypothetical protein